MVLYEADASWAQANAAASMAELAHDKEAAETFPPGPESAKALAVVEARECISERKGRWAQAKARVAENAQAMATLGKKCADAKALLDDETKEKQLETLLTEQQVCI